MFYAIKSLILISKEIFDFPKTIAMLYRGESLLLLTDAPAPNCYSSDVKIIRSNTRQKSIMVADFLDLAIKIGISLRDNY